MQDEPIPSELIKVVADFLRNEITPEIKGHNAFKLRVGINALDLVTRQLALESAGDAAEATRPKGLSGSAAWRRGSTSASFCKSSRPSARPPPALRRRGRPR